MSSSLPFRRRGSRGAVRDLDDLDPALRSPEDHGRPSLADPPLNGRGGQLLTQIEIADDLATWRVRFDDGPRARLQAEDDSAPSRGYRDLVPVAEVEDLDVGVACGDGRPDGSGVIADREIPLVDRDLEPSEDVGDVEVAL